MLVGITNPEGSDSQRRRLWQWPDFTKLEAPQSTTQGVYHNNNNLQINTAARIRATSATCKLWRPFTAPHAIPTEAMHRSLAGHGGSQLQTVLEQIHGSHHPTSILHFELCHFIPVQLCATRLSRRGHAASGRPPRLAAAQPASIRCFFCRGSISCQVAV